MQLLAGTLYDPGTAVAKATSSRLAMTAFDTTNLRLAFTTPVNCTAVFVRIRTNLSGATTMPQVLLGVLDGSTVKGRQVAQGSLPGTAVATTNVSLWAEFLITGLSGNTAYTYDAAYGVETEVASTNIHYGGPNNTTANDAWGGFVFEIWDPAPAPANFDVFSIDTNGRIDVIKVAGTTQTAGDIIGDTNDIQARLPAALVGGKMDSDATAISGDTTAADNLEKEYDGTGYGHILQRTTIATLSSQTSFTLTAGSADNSAYNGCIAVIEDASTAAQKAVGVVSAYTGASKTVTLLTDPGVFTMAAGDIITLIADRALKPTVDNRTVDVTTTGGAGVDWGNVENPTTTVNLSGTTVKNATDVLSDTANIKTRIPAALSGDGFIKADLKSIEDELTSGNNATLNLKKLNIVNNSGTALIAQSTGSNGNGVEITGNGDGHGAVVSAGGYPTGTGTGLYLVGGAGNGLQVFSNSSDGASFSGGLAGVYVYGEEFGFEAEGNTGPGINALSHGSDAIHAEVDNGNGDGFKSIGFGTGKSINAPNDIAVSDGDLTLAAIAAAVWANATRTLTSFGTLIADAVDAIWDEATSGHTTAGTTGKALIDAGAAGDPWGTSLPGSYGAGTAGKIVGDNINATISSRSSHSASDVWAVGTRTLTSFGTLVSDIWTAVVDSAGVTTLLSRLTSGRASNLDNLDAAISSRLAAVSYTAPDNAGIAAIKVQTDKFGFDSDNYVYSHPMTPVTVDSDDITTISIESAETVLKYDWTTITGEAPRSLLNAARKLRNKVAFDGSNTLTIYKENGVTSAYTQAVTSDSDQEPFKELG